METVKVTFTANTGYVGSEASNEVEFEKEDWDNMSDDEKFQCALDALYGLEISWSEEDECEDE